MSKLTLTPLKSSMLAGAHYDPKSQVLTVEYSSGHRYEHRGVSQKQVDGLHKAESAGAYFNAHIKPHHEAKRI